MIRHRHLFVPLFGAALFACGGGGVDVRPAPVSAGAAGSSGTTAGSSGDSGAMSGSGPGAGGASTTGMGGMPTATGGTSAAAGAGDGGAGGDGLDCGSPFVAFASDFAAFETWPSFYLGNVPPTTNEMVGPRTVYINKLPPHGSTQFPVGTIIVKAIQNGDKPTWQIFAMVKRGGCFNPLGSHGWEWFEVTLESPPISVLWRGVAPPNGSGYGGGKFGGLCNGCHDAFDQNDYVQGDFLQLSAL